MADVQHASLTADADLHEPKGAAAATSGEVYVADGAGSGGFAPYGDAGSVGAAKGIVNKAADVGALTDNTGETPDDTIDDVSVVDSTSGTADGTIASVDVTDSTGGSQDGTLANGSVTDSTGGSQDGTLVAISGSGDDTNINNNFTDVAAALGALNNNFADVAASIGASNNNFADLAAAVNSINAQLSNLADHINDIRTNMRAAGLMD